MEAYRDEHLFVDLLHRLVTLDGEILALSRSEYRLLALLVEHGGRSVPKPVLLMQIWGYVPETRTRTLDVLVAQLRKKLGTHAGRRNHRRDRIQFPATPWPSQSDPDTTFSDLRNSRYMIRLLRRDQGTLRCVVDKPGGAFEQLLSWTTASSSRMGRANTPSLEGA